MIEENSLVECSNNELNKMNNTDICARCGETLGQHYHKFCSDDKGKFSKWVSKNINQKEPMRNYLMINGEKMVFSDDVVEKFRNIITKNSLDDKCKELNEMVRRRCLENDKAGTWFNVTNNKIRISFPSANTELTIQIMRCVDDFIKKYSGKFRIECFANEGLFIANF